MRKGPCCASSLDSISPSRFIILPPGLRGACYAVDGLLAAISAAINGTVKDSSGAVVEGATITLTNIGTGGVAQQRQQLRGQLCFHRHPAGDLLDEGYKDRFQLHNATANYVERNQTATFDFTLTVGATQQSVTVEGAAVAIESSTAELGTVINEQAVKDLPLNGRNFTQLLTLTPGASPVSVAQNSGGGGGFAGNAVGSFSFPLSTASAIAATCS